MRWRIMVDKKQVISELVKLLEDEDTEIIQVDFENQSEELYGYPYRYVESVSTGFSTIGIRLLNKKQHKKFVEKLKP
jgi:hypothetical protein